MPEQNNSGTNSFYSPRPGLLTDVPELELPEELLPEDEEGVEGL